MKPTVLSFFTPDGPYPRMAERLERSCKRLELNHLIAEVVSQGSWVKNVAQKAAYILRWARTLEGPVLWVDADGELVGPPELLYDCSEDFAVYADPKPRRWRPLGREKLALPPEWKGPAKWFLTGTLWFNCTPHALAFLVEWAREAAKRPKAYQQLLLQEVWCRVKPSTLWLPQAYTKIRNMSWKPDETGPEVIVHDLASVMQKGVQRK